METEFTADFSSNRKYYYKGDKLHKQPAKSLTHKPYELVGVEDVNITEEEILKKRAELLKPDNSAE